MINEAVVIAVNDWPEQIKVAGLPFLLQGWNTTFTRADLLREIFLSELPTLTTVESDGAPTYVADSYWLYNLFPIAPAEIIRIGGIWHLRRFDQTDVICLRVAGDKSVTGLLGRWAFANVAMKAVC